jgi:hypothetical protein
MFINSDLSRLQLVWAMKECGDAVISAKNLLLLTGMSI